MQHKIRKCTKYLFFAFHIFLLSACSHQLAVLFENPSMNEVEIEVFKPAKITIPYDIYKLLVVVYAEGDSQRYTKVNHYKRRSVDSDFILETVYRFNNNPLDSLTATFKNILDPSRRFQLINAEPMPFEQSNQPSGEALKIGNQANGNNWSKFQSLCDTHGADAILFLNEFKYVYDIYEVDNQAFNYFTIHYHLNLSLEWMLIDPDNKKVLDRKTTNKQDNWMESGSKALDIESFIRESNDYLIAFTNDIAFEYAERISPMWKPETRYYYISGPPEFKTANQYAENNQWERAKEIWEKYSQSENFVVAKHANYNLALANEILGDLDKAYELAKRVEDKYNSTRGGYYAELLKNRLKEQELLMKQLGN